MKQVKKNFETENLSQKNELFKIEVENEGMILHYVYEDLFEHWYANLCSIMY